MSSFYVKRKTLTNPLPLFSDLRSRKQRQRHFSFLCNRCIMAAWSVQSNSPRSYLYSSSSNIFVIHHYDYPHKLYINDNASITIGRVNRVSTTSLSCLHKLGRKRKGKFGKRFFLLKYLQTRIFFLSLT